MSLWRVCTRDGMSQRFRALSYMYTHNSTHTLPHTHTYAHTHTHKRFLNTLAKVPQNTYKNVPFVEEDLDAVMNEVPEFKYYMPESDIDNPFMNIPLDKAAVITNETCKSVSQPKLQFSKLENGLRIASIDKGGLTCNLGLFVDSGSRYEDQSNFGVSHMIETMAFHSTAHLSWLRTIKTVETLGANAWCTVGRDHIAYQSEGLREHMPIMVPLLTGNVLFPRLLPWEMKKNVCKFEEAKKKLEASPEALVTELLHNVAWQNNTLGHPLLASEKQLAHYTPDVLREFMLNNFAIDKTVFVGVNVNHDELCKWLMRSFAEYNPIPPNSRKTQKAVYTGGETRLPGAAPVTHLAVAFECENGWNSEDLAPITVLQSLMGGGGSFSTGGPGKGMYTRLFLNVLNRNEWVENCMSFNSQYGDSGLFGIYMTADPTKGESMISVMVEEFSKMSKVSSEELKRAKNALKSSIWMNLECRQIMVDDIGRQILMNDKVVSGQQFCDVVDAVTAEDIQRAVKKMLNKAPSVVVYGDSSKVPHYDKICQILRNGVKA